MELLEVIAIGYQTFLYVPVLLNSILYLYTFLSVNDKRSGLDVRCWEDFFRDYFSSIDSNC